MWGEVHPNSTASRHEERGIYGYLAVLDGRPHLGPGPDMRTTRDCRRCARLLDNCCGESADVYLDIASAWKHHITNSPMP